MTLDLLLADFTSYRNFHKYEFPSWKFTGKFGDHFPSWEWPVHIYMRTAIYWSILCCIHIENVFDRNSRIVSIGYLDFAVNMVVNGRTGRYILFKIKYIQYISAFTKK